MIGSASHRSIQASARDASGRDASTRDAVRDAGVCAFWLAGRCFGLDVRWVGEVVALDAVTRVPGARPAVRGIFSLRGEPIVVLDLVELLELGEREATAGRVGLVLRAAQLTAAIRVERVESIIPPGRGELTPRGAGEHRAVLGLLDDRATSGHIVTVLDTALLHDQLLALRYLTDADD